MDLETALKEIEALKAKNTELENNNTKTASELADTKERLRQRGEEFKKLRDMTEEDKKKLTDNELNLLKRQEELDEKAKQLEDNQAKFIKDQRDTIINKYVNEYSKGNKELAEKIRFNFDNTLKAVDANDDASIAKKASSAFALVKQESPDLVTSAINEGGRSDDSAINGNGFADSEAGKNLAASMGLSLGKPAEGGDKK